MGKRRRPYESVAKRLAMQAEKRTTAAAGPGSLPANGSPARPPVPRSGKQPLADPAAPIAATGLVAGAAGGPGEVVAHVDVGRDGDRDRKSVHWYGLRLDCDCLHGA